METSATMAPCPGPQFLQLQSRETGQGHPWAQQGLVVPKVLISPLHLLCMEGRELRVPEPSMAEKGWFGLHLAPGAPAAHVLHTPNLWSRRWQSLAPAQEAIQSAGQGQAAKRDIAQSRVNRQIWEPAPRISGVREARSSLCMTDTIGG